MSKKEAEKEKTVKVSKPKQGPPGDDKAKAKAKPKPAEPGEKEKAELAAQEKAKAKAAAEAARPPADPRLKVLKKFHGKFLPRGPLRDRHKILMERWASGEDHGGVTVEELKSLYNDWKTARAKPVKVAGLSR